MAYSDEERQKRRALINQLERELAEDMDKNPPDVGVMFGKPEPKTITPKDVAVGGAGCAAVTVLGIFSVLVSIGIPVVLLAGGVALFWWLLDVFGVR